MPSNNRPVARCPLGLPKRPRWGLCRTLIIMSAGLLFAIPPACVAFADQEEAVADQDDVARGQTATPDDASGSQPVVPPSESAGETEALELRGDVERDVHERPAYRTDLVRGKAVFLADALESEFGISTVPEVAENSLAMLTSDGEIIPIVENLRGRALRKDPRLRQMELAILARRYRRHPFIQILTLYEIDGAQRYEVDYWCDVCAIVMYETGPCSCCQDDNRLRKRPVAAEDWPPAAVRQSSNGQSDESSD